MSLQVWLPLNGNLENQGLCNLGDVVTNTATINNNGKIGQCYEFNGSNIIQFTKSNIISGNKWSAACWFYRTATGDRQYLVGINGTTASNFIFTLNIYKNKLTVRIAGTDYSSSVVLENNKWYHGVCTYNGSLKMYLNGELIYTKNSTVTPSQTSNLTIGARGGNAGYFTGRMNDVRIYDHALSDKEVKEISKGLILHYKLNNNMYNTIYDSSGYGNNGTIYGVLTTSTLSARYEYASYISRGDTNYITTPILNLPGDQITMNFWFKSSNQAPGSNYHMPLEATANSNYAYEMSIHKNGYLRGGLVVAGSRKIDNCTSNPILLNGNWHMCSMTYDGTIIKRYVDGVMEKSTSASGTLVTSTNFVLGHYGANTSYYCKEAYISDVRIYTTALSEADILELYNTSASIDSSGNAYARELVE